MKAAIRSLAILGTVSLAAVAASAAGQERETRDVTGFEAIEVGGSIELRVQQGQAFAVEVESRDGPASHVVTEVRGRTLRIHDDRSWFPFFFGGTRHRDTVRVALPRLVALTASGGSRVTSEGTVTGDRLELTTSGGADLTLDLSVASLEARTSGGSDLRLSGRAGATTLRSSGGSDLDASGLASDSADVSSSGGSDLSVGQSGTLVANASGGSDIRYTGEPRSLSVHTSGGGGVSRRPPSR